MKRREQRRDEHRAVLRGFSSEEQRKGYLSTSAVMRGGAAVRVWLLPPALLVWTVFRALARALTEYPLCTILLGVLLFSISRWFIAAPIPKMILLLSALALLFSTAVGWYLRTAFPQQGERLFALILLVLIVKLLAIGTVFQFWIVTPDEYTHYHPEAVLKLHNPSFSPSSTYSSFLALVYRITGPFIQVAKLGNLFFLTIAAIFTYRTALLLFGRAVAWTAFLLVQWTPQITIWGIPALREGGSILLLTAIGYLLTTFAVRPMSVGVGKVLLALLLIGLIYSIRAYVAVFVAVICCIVILHVLYAQRQKFRLHRIFLFSIIVLFLIAGIMRWGGMEIRSDAVTPPTIDILQKAGAMREWLSRGDGRNYGTAADIRTLTGALRFLPQAYAGVLFLPFPWHAENLKTFGYVLLAGLEYPLILLALVGGYVALRSYGRKTYPLLLLTFLILTFYGIIDPKVGNLVRHRTQVWVFLMLFAAKGLHYITADWPVALRTYATGRMKG